MFEKILKALATSVFVVTLSASPMALAGQDNDPCAAPAVDLKKNMRADSIVLARMIGRKGSGCRKRAGGCIGTCRKGRFCDMDAYRRCVCSKIKIRRSW